MQIISDMNMIDTIIAEMASKRNRPAGYPAGIISISALDDTLEAYYPKCVYTVTKDNPPIRKLDFKKAGKLNPRMVKYWKANIDEAPEEFVITENLFNKVNLELQRTTKDRKFLVRIEDEDYEDLWQVILFRKAVKEYITEYLGINISLFTDNMNTVEDIELTKSLWKDTAPLDSYVYVTIVDCKESLYQNLVEFGEATFSKYPIRLLIPSRTEIFQRMKIPDNCHEVGGAKIVIRTHKN